VVQKLDSIEYCEKIPQKLCKPAQPEFAQVKLIHVLRGIRMLFDGMAFAITLVISESKF